MRQLLLSALVDLPQVVAGHSYDTGASPPREGLVDDAAGIGTAYIVAVACLAMVTVGLLVWLSPSTRRARWRGLVRVALFVAVIATPLTVWSASSGGDEPTLFVEHAIARTGTPELVVSLVEDDANTLTTTAGKRAVRVECVSRLGQVVLDAAQRWPFIDEPGYDYPHVHQAASPQQLQRVERCRLRGTRGRFEADVTGAPVRARAPATTP